MNILNSIRDEELNPEKNASMLLSLSKNFDAMISRNLISKEEVMKFQNNYLKGKRIDQISGALALLNTNLNNQTRILESNKNGLKKVFDQYAGKAREKFDGGDGEVEFEISA